MIAAIRPSTLHDLEVICAQRALIFLESGRSPELIERIAGPTRAWHAEHMADGRYHGWLAEVGGEPVGGVGLVFLDWCPGASHPDADRRGLVLNLYVDPAHRGRGIARALMGQVEDAAHRRGVFFLVLHATDAGRPLYERLNWRATNEMSLSLTP